MAKLGIAFSLFAIVATFATGSKSDAADDLPCVLKEPKTDLLKQACATGGQELQPVPHEARADVQAEEGRTRAVSEARRQVARA